MKSIKEYVAIRKAEIKAEVDKLENKPKLVIIQVGNNDASSVYIRGKLKDCDEVGIIGELIHLSEETTEFELLEIIKKLNNDDTVTGFIVQLPLPKTIREEAVINAISPEKDVDGFSKLALVDPGTPRGMIDFLESENFDFKNKNAVVLGRSNIVGRPMARLLLDRSCNVTVLHSKTSEENKRLYLKNADLIITATGHLGLIDHTYELKPTAIILDVGMNRDSNNKLIGDCERDLPVAFQSPVPGSIGLSTRLSLIVNLLQLYKIKHKNIC